MRRQHSCFLETLLNSRGKKKRAKRPDHYRVIPYDKILFIFVIETVVISKDLYQPPNRTTLSTVFAKSSRSRASDQ